MSNDLIIKRLSENASKLRSAPNLVDRLKHEEFFKLFSPIAFAEIFSKAVTRHYKAGDFIYCRGDTDVFMGIVMTGRLRMSLTESDGRSVLIGLVEAGEVFGETALLDGLPRTTDAEADADSTLMLLLREDFMPALKQHP